MYKISIIVPVYNEQEAIKECISKLEEVMQKVNISECIVVDDNSNDGTLNILKATNLTVLMHSTHLGYGASLKTGIYKASGDIICIIDGDNTYHPGDIQKLVPFINKYDMVVGARIKDAARVLPFYQKIAKGFVCSLLSVIFKQKILDINSGLRLIRKNVLKKYLSILPNGFSFTASITLAMLLDNYKIKYIPINYSKRAGKSKVKVFNYTINFIKNCWKIINYCNFNNKLKQIGKK